MLPDQTMRGVHAPLVEVAVQIAAGEAGIGPDHEGVGEGLFATNAG